MLLERLAEGVGGAIAQLVRHLAHARSLQQLPGGALHAFCVIIAQWRSLVRLLKAACDMLARVAEAAAEAFHIGHLAHFIQQRAHALGERGLIRVHEWLDTCEAYDEDAGMAEFFMAVEGAANVLLGSMINHSAVARQAVNLGRDIIIHCAGTEGDFSADDICAAGAIATSICEIERGRLTRFKGNYSAYTVQKEAAVERQEKEYAMQQKEIAKLEDYVARNLVRASTSKSAKSRQKQLDKMERIEKPVTHQKRASLRFSYEIEPPLDVLEVREADISVGEGAERKTLLEQLSFAVRRGEKLAVIGPNGIGKSTLLKEILGILPHAGLIRFNKNVKIAYFDQESTNLNPLNTVLDELHDRFPAMLDGEIRSILGQVRITGEDVFKPISALSGGERARVCFALLMLEHANVMLLDEPTNHLDLPMKEVLEEALSAYTGTLIFVSHDRYFLKRLSSQILELSPDGAELHPYGFESYLDVKSKRKAAALIAQAQATAEKPRAAAPSHRTKAQRSADAARRNRMRELEQEIERLDQTIAELEEKLTLPEICTDYQKMNAVCAELEDAKLQSEACFMELCDLEEA